MCNATITLFRLIMHSFLLLILINIQDLTSSWLRCAFTCTIINCTNVINTDWPDSGGNVLVTAENKFQFANYVYAVFEVFN